MLFDVFGTVVDWRSSVIRELEAFGAARGIGGDWSAVADDWRGRYQPAMEEVRAGSRPWVVLDLLHRESLDQVWAAHGLPSVDSGELDLLNRAWHRLDPWPGVVEGLIRLRARVRVGTLSNGNTALLRDLADHGGLPWDVLLGAETAQAYKPLPEAYLRNVAILGLEPAEVMLVAAHNSDLAAASSAGLQTAFLPRLTEHGPGQTTDLAPTGAWDLVVPDMGGLADALA